MVVKIFGFLTFFSLSTALQGQVSTLDDLPDALRLMVVSRASIFSTAEIQWSVQWGDGTNSAKRSTYARNGFSFVEIKSLSRAPEAKAAPPFTYSDRRHLWFSSGDHVGEQWNHFDRSPKGTIRTTSSKNLEMTPDLRTMGQLPYIPAYDSTTQMDPFYILLEEIDRDGIDGFRERKMDDGHIQVTAESRSGDLLSWEIDPSLDWAPIRVQRWHKEELLHETTMEYGRFDDRWFLRSLLATSKGKPILRVEVEEAQFDQPYHAQELSVNQFMPMPMGTNFTIDDPGGAVRYLCYDGEDGYIDQDSPLLQELTRRGSFDFSNFIVMMDENAENPPGRFPKADEKGYYNDPKTAREPRLWENYTRSFIAVNKLQEKQTRAAWEVLRDCQRRAYEYLDKIKDNLKDLREDRAKAQSAIKGEFGDSQSAQNAEQELVQLEERENKLMEKIEAIFKDLLRPGLFKLLTPEQRQAEAARHFAQVKPETLTAEAAAKAKP